MPDPLGFGEFIGVLASVPHAWIVWPAAIAALWLLIAVVHVVVEQSREGRSLPLRGVAARRRADRERARAAAKKRS